MDTMQENLDEVDYKLDTICDKLDRLHAVLNGLDARQRAWNVEELDTIIYIAANMRKMLDTIKQVSDTMYKNLIIIQLDKKSWIPQRWIFRVMKLDILYDKLDTLYRVLGISNYKLAILNCKLETPELDPLSIKLDNLNG